MTLLIDIGACCEHHTNDTLEHLHKAIGEGDPDLIWDRHPSPLIEALVELFSSRGLLRLESVRKAVLKWQSGANFDSGLVPPIKPDVIQRWTKDERELMRLYLKALPPAQWTLDDHMMSIDLVVQDYMPAGELAGEAEWLAVRAGMMGKVQANLEAEPSVAQGTKIAQAMPSTVAGAVQQFGIVGRFREMLDFARVRAVESVRALTDDVRHRMRAVVLQDLDQRAAGAVPPGTSSLETKLLDELGTLNRDWRRIAVTEAGEALNQGLIASMPAGARMKRIEQYRGACPFCRKIDGVVMEVVDAADPDKNGETQIWPGKNNIGRSAAARKRVGGALVPREADELYWVPAGVAHPHCRGRWLREPDVDPADDADFAAVLRDILGTK